MPSRRDALGLLGTTLGSVALAGCLGDSTDAGTSTSDGNADSIESPNDEPSPTHEPTGEPAGLGDTRTVDGVDLTLRRVVVQGSLLTVFTDSGAVTENPDGRYVLAKLSTTAESAPAAGEYGLAVDGSPVGSVTPRGNFWTVPGGRRTQYTPPEAAVSDGPGGWLAFPVEGGLAAESPRLTVGSASWRLPERAVERLRKPAAEYDLVGFDYPETVATEESFTVSVTAKNVGSVAGAFRGMLNTSVQYASYPHPIRMDLSPGEQGTWELSYGVREGLNEPGDSGGLLLETVGGDADGRIEVPDSAGTSTPQER